MGRLDNHIVPLVIVVVGVRNERRIRRDDIVVDDQHNALPGKVWILAALDIFASW